MPSLDDLKGLESRKGFFQFKVKLHFVKKPRVQITFLGAKNALNYKIGID